jgi:hypothetical protein
MSVRRGYLLSKRRIYVRYDRTRVRRAARASGNTRGSVTKVASAPGAESGRLVGDETCQVSHYLPWPLYAVSLWLAGVTVVVALRRGDIQTVLAC